MFALAITFAHLNGSRQALQDIERMWENCYAFDRGWARHFRYQTHLIVYSVPGKKFYVKFLYRLAHRIIRFN
jgi:hypothetical protein